MVTIDLHGFTLEQVKTYLEDKLENVLEHDERIIKIIHGQGKHSEYFPVIKSFVRNWLENSDFAKEKVEIFFRGEDGTPYTPKNPGETVVILKGDSNLAEVEISWEDEEENEAKRLRRKIKASRKHFNYRR